MKNRILWAVYAAAGAAFFVAGAFLDSRNYVIPLAIVCGAMGFIALFHYANEDILD